MSKIMTYTCVGLMPWPNHDPDADAKGLHAAMKGWGTTTMLLSLRANESRIS